MKRRYVWIISDEKYGAQAVYASKRLADRALEEDKHSYLTPSGYSAVPLKFLVRT